MTSILNTKPILSRDDPGRSKPIGPFINPPEDFIVARIGDAYKLIVNKFCVYRPMLVLHTSLFAPQTEDLNLSDVSAVWAILREFQSPQMIIYNCGVEAGSSQGHKHLQIFPRQDSAEFQMWPSLSTGSEGKSFHFVIGGQGLPHEVETDTAAQVSQRKSQGSPSNTRSSGCQSTPQLIMYMHNIRSFCKRPKRRCAK